MSAEAKPLDPAAVQRLTSALLEVVRRHYQRRPVARATAQEVLNATAIVAAMIICAARDCGDEAGAHEFFMFALEQQLAEPSTPTTLGELDGVLQ